MPGGQYECLNRGPPMNSHPMFGTAKRQSGLLECTRPKSAYFVISMKNSRGNNSGSESQIWLVVTSETYSPMYRNNSNRSDSCYMWLQIRQDPRFQAHNSTHTRSGPRITSQSHATLEQFDPLSKSHIPEFHRLTAIAHASLFALKSARKTSYPKNRISNTVARTMSSAYLARIYPKHLYPQKYPAS